MKFLGYTLGDPNAPMAPPTRKKWTRWASSSRKPPKPACCWPPAGSGRWAKRSRCSIDGSDFTVLDGPFTEAKELIGGWGLLECRDRDEAIEWTKRFLALARPGRDHRPHRLRPLGRTEPGQRPSVTAPPRPVAHGPGGVVSSWRAPC